MALAALLASLQQNQVIPQQALTATNENCPSVSQNLNLGSPNPSSSNQNSFPFPLTSRTTETQSIGGANVLNPLNLISHGVEPTNTNLNPLLQNLMLCNPPPSELVALQQQVESLTEHKKSVLPHMPDLELTPPYPLEIVCLSYPNGYITPKFTKFNDKNGSSHEYVAWFIESLDAITHIRI